MYLPAPDSGRRFQTAVILFSSKFIVFTFSTEISYTGWSERSVSIVFHAVTLSMNFHLVEAALYEASKRNSQREYARVAN